MNKKSLIRAILGDSEKSDGGLKVLLKLADENTNDQLDEIKELIKTQINDKLNGLANQCDNLVGVVNDVHNKYSLLEANDKILVEEICKIRDTVQNSLDEDFIHKKLKPLVSEIADLAFKIKDSLYLTSDDNDSKLAKRISIILESFLELLKNNNAVDLILPEKGEVFCDDSFVAVRAVDTNNPELDRRVAEVCKAGVILNDRILRPAEVAVYRYIEIDTDLNERTENEH